MTLQYDVVVVGAGAGGMMAALSAGQRGKSVLLLEHGAEAGRKIIISGGGRCNFTNRETAPARYFSANPAFCISALRRYQPEDFIALMQKHKIAFHEKKLGQLFCDGSAKAIVTMLLAECAAADVTIRYQTTVKHIEKNDLFRIQLENESITSRSLIIATGGLSIPKLGATGFAYDVARQFDVAVIPPRPALVPLSLAGNDDVNFQELAGVSLPAQVRCSKVQFEENILFTHRGLSGPAILQISTVWREGMPLFLSLLPRVDIAASLLRIKAVQPKILLKTALGQFLPQRFADEWCRRNSLLAPIGACRDAALPELAKQLKHWSLLPAGTEGYAKAEVTAGGVDTAALSSQTMMVKSVPGLYFVGEAVDVTGWLGGYNFQWAWSSGWCAGQAV